MAQNRALIDVLKKIVTAFDASEPALKFDRDGRDLAEVINLEARVLLRDILS